MVQPAPNTSWKKMMKPKKGGGYLTRSSHKNKRAYNGGGEATDSLFSVLHGHPEYACAKMLKPKRGGAYLTRSAYKNHFSRALKFATVLRQRNDTLKRTRPKRAYNGGGGAIESLISGDLHGHSDDDACTKLSDEVVSNLYKSVVSLALSNGHKVLFACSGIAIECQRHVTRVLTSASLVRALSDAKKRNGGILKIEVRHEGCEVHSGFLAEHSLDHNFAVVIIMTFLDAHLVLLKPAMEILPHSKVIAVGRDISGKAMTRSVILASDLSGSEDRQGLMLPSNGTSEGWEGGALFNSDGNFVAMNLYSVMERTFFLSWSIILERLEHYFTSLHKKYFPQFLKSLKAVRVGGRPSGGSNSHQEVHRDIFKEQFGDLDLDGYPRPPVTMQGDGMILVNTFEETFGDACGKGVWNRLSKKVSNVNRYVVALASFNGQTRVFACTGFFIEWKGCTIILTSASLVRDSGDQNKINENLRTEVLLSNSRRREGKLQHYDLHNNVAVVSVKDCLAIRPADTQPEWYKCCSRHVLAVGRCFKSNTVMAASGILVFWSGRLDCQKLVYSSCKIRKARIGGPLVDLDGESCWHELLREDRTPFPVL